MRETRKKWFVIVTEMWEQEWHYAHDSMDEAVKDAENQWNSMCSKDREHQFIQVAELWAVFDEDEGKWIPIFDWDEEYDPATMEGEYAGAYTPVLNLGVSED